MLIGALLKYIVYKIILGHIFLRNSWTECSISKVLQEIVFLHYVGEKRIVLFNKAEEIYFSVEFLRSRSISIVSIFMFLHWGDYAEGDGHPQYLVIDI